MQEKKLKLRTKYVGASIDHPEIKKQAINQLQIIGGGRLCATRTSKKLRKSTPMPHSYLVSNIKPLISGSKAITLIALIITIIVMLILVGVTVSVAINGGLFSNAKQAKTDTQKEIDKEQELSNGRVKIDGVWYDSMDSYIEGTPSENQPLPNISEAKKNGEFMAENATFTDNFGTAVIPKGFKIINGIEGEQSIAKGLVIQDKEGNEFVWIPVNYTATGTKDENGLDSGFLDVFYRSDWSNNERGTKYDNTSDYKEPYSDGYEGEEEEYYNMMRSVQKNKGFYIGRYESGAESPHKSGWSSSVSLEPEYSPPIVVKRDVYPYIEVSWGNEQDDIDGTIYYNKWYYGKGAVYLSKHFYDNKNVGVTSCLCYGTQWDAMLEFISKNTNLSILDSTDWGNFRKSSKVINRTTAKYYQGSDSWIEVPAEGLTNSDMGTYSILTTRCFG